MFFHKMNKKNEGIPIIFLKIVESIGICGCVSDCTLGWGRGVGDCHF